MTDRWPEGETIARREARRAVRLGWPGEPDDWHQDALLAAWEAHRSHDDHRGPYRRWIVWTVRQRLVDALRQANRRRPLVAAVRDVIDHRAPEDGPGCDYRDLLAELARHLTPAERRVALATFEAGDHRRQAEVAADLGLSQARVSGLQSSAFDTIRHVSRGKQWASA